MEFLVLSTASLLIYNIVLFRADALAVNKTAQTPLDIACFWNHTSAANALRKFLSPPSSGRMELVHHYTTSVVNRQSYQRSDTNYIESVKISDR